jgi:hypothetical protein
MSQWQFNTYRLQDKRRDPIQGEFFSSEAISDPGRALVREGIQNSLDAAAGTGPVLVRIYVSGQQNAKPRSEVEAFFAGGWEHFAAPRNGLKEIPAAREACDFLVFEDFNTKGLTGDIAEVEHIEGRRNAFFHFFRADGISDKGEGDRGSWGVGKTVFQRASRLNAMFGLTVRSDDKRALLMGMTILKSHRLGQQSFMPDGWFGVRSENGIVMPVTDANLIERFRKCFHLERGSEPGLSIIVPWLDREVTEAAIVESVLRDYFYPILTGRLDVIVKTPTTEIVVSKDSLDEEIGKIGGVLAAELQPVVQLARWSLTQGVETIPKLNAPPGNKAMEWSDRLIPESLLPVLRRQLMSNDRLAVRVPVNVRKKGAATQTSYFDVFMVRDGAERIDRPVYVRAGLIIPDVRAPRTRGLTALVIAEDRPIATFLGDSENPSHTQWQHDGSHFKGIYTSGRKDLDFVVRSVRELVRLLSESEGEEDLNLLADVFNLPGTATTDDVPDDDDGDETDKGAGPEKRTPLPFRISRQTGGFVVVSSKPEEDFEGTIEVQAAYEVRRGNAFSRYIPEDFDLEAADFQIDTNDVDILIRKNNRIRFKPQGRRFRLAVRGFDERRDLRIRVTLLEE